jgi:hypothetical protein
MLHNHTDFPLVTYRSEARGGLRQTVIVRACFDILDSGTLRVSASQRHPLTGREWIFKAGRGDFDDGALLALRASDDGNRLFVGRAPGQQQVFELGTLSEVFVFQMPRQLLAVAVTDDRGERRGTLATLNEARLDLERSLLFAIWHAEIAVLKNSTGPLEVIAHQERSAPYLERYRLAS